MHTLLWTPRKSYLDHWKPVSVRRCGDGSDPLILRYHRTTQTIPQLYYTQLQRALEMGFGDFDTICQKAALPLCSLVGPASSISGATGIIPNCYARNIELANTIIFEGAASFVHIIALAMTVIMILHIRSKFTAVGT